MSAVRTSPDNPLEPLAAFGQRETPLALQPVLLGAGDTVWIVEEGGLDLFHVAIDNGCPVGARRHVCRIGPGEALVDRPGLLTSALMAVALSGTVCLRLENGGAAPLADPAVAGIIRRLLEGWSARLLRAWPGLPAEAADPRATQCVLLTLLEQRAQEAAAREQAAIDAKALSEADGLGRALSGIAQVLAASDAPAPGGGSALHACCAMVLHASGRALDKQIAAPPATSDTERWLELFCRKHRLAKRRVALSGPAWWREDLGPLLGFRATDGAALALVPDARGYLLTDPADGSRRQVDEAIAAGLARQAIMFFNILPGGPVRFRELLRFGLAGSGRDRWRLLGFGLAGGALGLVTPFVTRLLVDKVLPGANRGELGQLVLMLLISAVGVTAFTLCRGLAAMRVQARLGNSTQAAVIERLLCMPAPFFRDHEAGDLAQRALGIDSILQMIGNTAEGAIFGWVFGLFSLFYLFFLDVRLALLAVLLVGIELSWTLGLNYWALLLQRKGARISGDIASRVFQILNGVAKLRAHGAEPRAFALWANLFAEQKTLDVQVRRISITLATMDAGYSLVCSIVVFAAVAFLLPGTQTGQFIAFSTSFAQFLAATLALNAALSSTLAVIPLYERARPILETVPESGEGQHAPGELSGAIDISGVSFRYSADGPEILSGVSLHIHAGEFIALVGPSGCGKSTLCRLLLGFERPQAGAIYYDGQDFAGLDKVAVRRQLGVVLQNGRLMAGDVYTNIVGAAPLSMDDAWEAARLAGLEDELRNMPMGMHTLISEGASTISGGQKQRLMVARAIVRKPRILLFDEATSALDNRTQAIVAASIAELKATRIVVAHRLSTIMGADRIFFIEGGRVVETGTYAELMQLNGRFTALAERQLT
jgi:ATP-binding cassette subfamily C protein